MELLKLLQRLIDMKKGFMQVAVNLGIPATTLCEIVAVIKNIKQGDIDKAISSALTDEDEVTAMPTTIYDTLAHYYTFNETLWASVDTVTARAFKNSTLVYFKRKETITSLDETFYGCIFLTFAELNNVDQATTLTSTFQGCSSLIAVSFPETWEGCTSVAHAFNGCTSLRSNALPMELPNCTTLAYAFNGCKNLKGHIVFSSLPKVTMLSYAFNGCSSLSSVTLPSAMPALTTLGSAFRGCSSLSSVALPTQMPALTSMSDAFSGCSSLSSVTLPTEMPALKSLNSAFSGCSSLSSVTLPTEMPALTSMSNAFEGCSSLNTPLDIDCTNVLAIKECHIFNGCKNIPSLTLHSTANIHNFNNFIYNCTSLTSVTGLDLSNAFLSIDEVKQVAAANKLTITDADAESIYLKTSWMGCTQTNTKLTNMPLQGTLYRSGFSIASCPLTAESLYTWFVALYDWTNNPEAKTTDDTLHTLTVNATSLANMQAYTPTEGLSGEAIYEQALDRGWIIAKA